MASRRMFSKNIINSAQFLKMPPSSQMLYFHLGLNADDDGVVEAFTIMRMVGACEDDLKILAAKKLITVLNEDLVTFINDWLEHNIIRPDRKIDSKYKDLLIRIAGEGAKLIEPKERADRLGRPRDGKRTAQGSIGQGSIGENKKEKDTYSTGVERGYSNFDKFWKEYPRRQARKAAFLKWKSKKCEDKIEDILDDVEYRKTHPSPNGWLDTSTNYLKLEFIPLPSTYLNGERWDDEVII